MLDHMNSLSLSMMNQTCTTMIMILFYEENIHTRVHAKQVETNIIRIHTCVKRRMTTKNSN
jgi:hypothetical protein